MPYDIFLAGLMLGIGTGSSCMALCLPVLAPHVAISHPGARRGLLASVLFGLGRLAAYLTLGLIFGFFGGAIIGEYLLAAPLTIALGFLLVLYGLTISLGYRLRIGSRVCSYLEKNRSTVLLGFLAGFKPCPPLLSAVAYSITIGSMLESLLFMTMFWLGSSLLTFILGAAAGSFSSLASLHITMERVKRICAMALVIVGFYFLIEGIILTAQPIT